MALTSLEWAKTAPRNHVVSFTDDYGGIALTRTVRIEVPNPVPEDYDNAADYVYEQTKAAILRHRRKIDRKLARVADETNNWSNPTNEQQTKIDAALLQLQSELDG